MEENPPTPYASFAKILSSYHSEYAEPGPSSLRLDAPLRYEAILDESGGMINSLMGSIEENVRAQMPLGNWEMGNEEMSEDERDSLLKEHRTWQLVRAVYENRLHRLDAEYQPDSAEQLLAENPYISPEELCETILNEDPEISLYATLVDHLQSRPLLNKPPPLEARHGYLPSTLHRAKAASLQARPPTPPSLDPDFTLRDPHGQSLAGEDLTYQSPLLETLWDLVRHGELDQAVKLCEEGGEPWRGATLMGGRRWNMGGMTLHSTSGPSEGNRGRLLWKKSCCAMANNPTLSPSERYLYAALVSDLPTLLPACESWEDHLWAHIQSRMEARLEARWHELGGFWEGEERLLGRYQTDDSVRGGLDELFASISQSGSAAARAAATDPYHAAQRLIVQGRTDAMFNQFADHIPNLDDQMSPQLVGPLIRFFAHLVLVLRSMNQSVPDTASNLILEAYLSILEREGNNGLVAMYAACLREGNGEESYARFLRAMDPNASREEKMDALSKAKQHKLDVAIIARETVRMVLEDHFASVPALSVEQPDITTFATGLNDRDVHLIRSIEWLTMVPETAKDALIQANSVARYFLALGQAGAAQALLKTLPAGMAHVDMGDGKFNQVTEHDHYRALFSAFASHELVDDFVSRTPQNTATKMETHAWKKNLLSGIERTQKATIELLTSDWLSFYIPTGLAGISRRAELDRIRQIFIPDLVLRLHNLLTTHHSTFPHLLQDALDLTMIVATEEYHVYEEFFGQRENPYRLIAYLEKVREAGLAALDSGSGSAFVVKV